MKLTAKQRQRTIAALEGRAMRLGLLWLWRSVLRMHADQRSGAASSAAAFGMPPTDHPNCRCAVGFIGEDGEEENARLVYETGAAA